jgi:hypothetical protein
MTTPNTTIRELVREELTTAAAIAVLMRVLRENDVETVELDDAIYQLTAESPLYTATEYGICNIVGFEETDEEAMFVLYKEPTNSALDDGELLFYVPVVYPIRTSFEDASADYSVLAAEKVETHYIESL